jgi:hypothetical protein
MAPAPSLQLPPGPTRPTRPPSPPNPSRRPHRHSKPRSPWRKPTPRPFTPAMQGLRRTSRRSLLPKTRGMHTSPSALRTGTPDRHPIRRLTTGAKRPAAPATATPAATPCTSSAWTATKGTERLSATGPRPVFGRWSKKASRAPSACGRACVGASRPRPRPRPKLVQQRDLRMNSRNHGTRTTSIKGGSNDPPYPPTDRR